MDIAAWYNLPETQREKHENTKQETPSMWEGCYRTFRVIPALPCHPGVDNTLTQNSLYGNMTFGQSWLLTALIQLRLVKMWAKLVIFYKELLQRSLHYDDDHQFHSQSRDNPDLTTNKTNNQINPPTPLSRSPIISQYDNTNQRLRVKSCPHWSSKKEFNPDLLISSVWAAIQTHTQL